LNVTERALNTSSSPVSRAPRRAALAVAAIVALALTATGCLNDGGRAKGTADVHVSLEKVGALGKTGAANAVEMSLLFLTLRSPGEDTRRDTLPLSGNGQQSILKSYANLTTLKTWTLEAIAKDAQGISVYRDSVKFTVPPEGTANVELQLKAAYSMLKASFYPIRDSVSRCQLWVNGNLVRDSSFAQQSRVGDTVVLAWDYLPTGAAGKMNTVRLDVYGNWYGASNTLLYRGETTFRVFSGQDAYYDIELTRYAPLAPIGQASMKVTIGAVGTVAFKGRLEDKSWTYSGDTTGISTGVASHVSLRRDSNDVMQVAYSNEADGGKATLLRWDGSNWSTVGNPAFTPGVATNLSLSFSATATYVAFRDSANQNKASVMRWDGTSWGPVGSYGLSQGEVRFPSMVVSPAGAPTIAFQDVAQGQRLSVARWNGSAWVYLGTPGGASPDKVSYLSLAFAPDGTPYVAYRDEGAAGNLSIVRWNGTAWEYVGARGVYSGDVYNVNLAVSSNGTPYVAFQGFNEGYTVSVIQWVDGAWKYLGYPGVTPSTGADNLTMTLSKGDRPYIAYRLRKADGNDVADVMMWNGAIWQSIRGQRISKGYADSYSLAVSDSGTPFLAFRDFPLGAKLVVMNYAEPCCLGYPGGSLAKTAAR
jgi:hypothetical protein